MESGNLRLRSHETSLSDALGPASSTTEHRLQIAYQNTDGIVLDQKSPEFLYNKNASEN